MKFVCAAWFVLIMPFHCAEVAADNETLMVFINEISHALKSQWEILQNIRHHTLVNKIWLRQLLAELDQIEGRTRVNRRNSPSEEQQESGVLTSDFLHNFQEIVHELQALQLMLNTTDGSDIHAFNNHTDADGNAYKNVTVGLISTERSNSIFSERNDEHEKGFPPVTTKSSIEIMSSSTSASADASTTTTAMGTNMSAVISRLGKLNLLLIDEILSVKEAASSTAPTTTTSPLGDISAPLTELENLFREHFGQQNTSGVPETTTEQPTIHDESRKLTRIIESLRDLASYLRPHQNFVTDKANVTTGTYTFIISYLALSLSPSPAPLASINFSIPPVLPLVPYLLSFVYM